MNFTHGTVLDCPCADCGDRKVGCHSQCKRYKKYRKNVAFKRHNRKESEKVEAYFINRIRKAEESK